MSSSYPSTSSLKRPSASLLSDDISNKKPRFSVRNPSALLPADDGDDRDAVLDADVIGSRGHQHKRGAVNIDGYDSDSDHDNFDRRAAAKNSADKAAREKSRMEEENDMFAELKGDFDETGAGGSDEEKSGKKKKKGVRFVEAKDLMEKNSEDLSSKAGGHVSADFSLSGKRKAQDQEVGSSSEEEVDDEVRADIGDVDEELGAGSKKTHAPKLDAFNMRDEQQDGAFDDQGNYIRKATDPDAVHDSWLEGMSKKDMRAAKEAADKREQDRRKRELENNRLSVADVLKQLIPLLQRGETVLEALARIGKGKKKEKKWQMKQKKRNQATNGVGEDAEMEGEDPVETKRKQEVEAITAAADLLLTKGQAEVYDTERELLKRQYTRETGEQWIEPATTDLEDRLLQKNWEYRWTDTRDGGNINGPYDHNTMKQWNEAGYFGNEIEYRRVGTSEWSRVADF